MNARHFGKRDSEKSTVEPEAESIFPRIKIPDAKEVIVGELTQPGDWIVASIETTGSWTVTTQRIRYRGETIWILPVMKEHSPAVVMKVGPGKGRPDCERLLMRFISTLSWVEGIGILPNGIGGGSRPFLTQRSSERGLSIRDYFDLSYFPEPENDRALLALALMREGRGLNHPAYAFLSFFRVLEVALPEGKARKAWVGANASLVTSHVAKSALGKLQARGIADIGAHLYESGRCAIAHASVEPIIDPDDPSDARRLFEELPIMAALAEKAIEEQLGVETSLTVYRKHLYELAGFKDHFGEEVVSQLAQGRPIPEGRLIDIPEINVRIRRREPYRCLSNLSSKFVQQEGKTLHILFESKNGNVQMHFHLDFGEERLNFNLWSDLGVADNGGVESAKEIIEVERFHAEYFGNGQLELFNADNGVLIARKDAYIPVNMMFNSKGAEAGMKRLERMLEERLERDRKFGEAFARYAIPYSVTFKL